MSSSVFSVVRKGPPVEMFVLGHAFYIDKFKNKVDLAVGSYRGPDGKPFGFPVVRKVGLRLITGSNLNYEYLPVLGDIKMRDATLRLLLGSKSKAIKDKCAFSVQTLAGTGAVRLGAAFLRTTMCRKNFMISEPEGENYCAIFKDAGFENGSAYCYWNNKERKLNIEGIMEALCEAKNGTVVVMHGCCHNPTGMDLSHAQWKEIAEVMKKKSLFPFFDLTRQGIATGDPEQDAWPVRYFVDQGFELMAAQSFAQSMGLYAERVGTLTIVQSNKKTTDTLKSRLSQLVRGMYTAPPAYGSRIVSTILTNKCLHKEWLETIKTISLRLKLTRNKLATRLDDLETPGNWYHINKHRGFFTYSGLCDSHINQLIKDYHIYLRKNGAINISAINDQNFDYVAEAIHNVVARKKSKSAKNVQDGKTPNCRSQKPQPVSKPMPLPKPVPSGKK